MATEFRLARPVHALLLLLAASMSPAALARQPSGPAELQCQIAFTKECRWPGAAGIPSAGELQVADFRADSFASCVAQAREVGRSCGHETVAKNNIKLRYRSGAIWLEKSLRNAEFVRSGDRIQLPIKYGLEFEAEEEIYAYSPHFAPGTVDFDREGGMLVRHDTYLQIGTAGGKWRYIDLMRSAIAAIERLPAVAEARWVPDIRRRIDDQRIYLDSLGRLYTLIQGVSTRLKDGSQLIAAMYLIASGDGGSSWTAVAVPLPDDRVTWRGRIEHNDHNNDRSAPPPVLLFDQDSHPDRRSSDLYLVLTDWDVNGLRLSMNQRIASNSLLQGHHSGAANSVVSTGTHVYVVYPGNISLRSNPGTPAYLVSIDKRTGLASRGTTPIGYGGAAKAVDNHNVPGICLGSRGLHVLLTGHQEPLGFRSGSIDSDGNVRWNDDVERIGAPSTAAGGYTYGSLNCDRRGNIYVISRWSGDNYRFQLVLLKRNEHGAWESDPRGQSHMVLVDPGRSYYGAWRQRATLDSQGSLFISYSYLPNHLSVEELAALKRKFPFRAWNVVKQNEPHNCRPGKSPRCWYHPMLPVTSAVIRSELNGWFFVE